MGFKFLFLALVFLPAFSVLADGTAPECNPSSEDSTLFNGQTARAFFAARAADTACQAKYTQAKAAFDGAVAKLRQLAASGASADELDNQDSAINAARGPFLEALSECGPCAVRPMADPVEFTDSSGHQQVWYQSDGSCQLATTDKAALTRAFETLSTTFTTFAAFPRQPKTAEGFHPILSLQPVDSTSGQPLSGVQRLDPNKAITGLMILQGPLVASFSYYFDGTYKISGENGARQFTMHEEGVAPANARPPRTVTFFTAGGKRKLAVNTALAHSNGQFYVNEDGYLRYCTSADFGGRSQLVESFGRTMHLDILSTAIEKAEAK